MEEVLEEWEIDPANEIYADEMIFYDDCLPKDEREIENLKEVITFEEEMAGSKKLKEKLENQRRIGKGRSVATSK